MKKVVTVLDFTTGEVCVYHYSPEDLKENFEDEIELFIESKKHSVDNCLYMCADEFKLKIDEIV